MESSRQVIDKETTGIRRGWINHILPHSFVDGPGNRVVVFLQGCSLRCLYCHNPYTINVCNHCGLCVATCSSGALSQVNSLVVWDHEICRECDTCIQTCPNDSSPRVTSMSAQELWQSVASYASFISGITISGGEPALQADFVAEFLAIVKKSSSLTTLIETNGYAGPQAYLSLLEHLDMTVVDLKSIDPSRHIELTGRSLTPIQETIRFLYKQKKLFAIQQVVVPGFTDTETSAAETARFIAEIDPHICFKFLRFRPHGTRGPAETWPVPSEEVMDRLVETARQAGLVNVQRSM